MKELFRQILVLTQVLRKIRRLSISEDIEETESASFNDSSAAGSLPLIMRQISVPL